MAVALPVNKTCVAEDSALFEQGSAFDGARGATMRSTTEGVTTIRVHSTHHQPVTSHVATMKRVDSNPLFWIWRQEWKIARHEHGPAAWRHRVDPDNSVSSVQEPEPLFPCRIHSLADLVSSSIHAPATRTSRPTIAPSAVHLVAGSTTSLVFPQIARKRSLKTGSCSHARSVCSYPDEKTRCGALATRLGLD